MPKEFAGKPITKDIAEKYVTAFLPLKDCLINKFLPTVQVSKVQALQETVDDTFTYYKSPVNAFVFSKELIMRFFPEDQTKPHAEYLMVILASKFDGDDKGQPTVVVAGVNKQGDDFVSLDIDDPATEQPPRRAIPKFPGHGMSGPNKIVFTVM